MSDAAPDFDLGFDVFTSGPDVEEDLSDDDFDMSEPSVDDVPVDISGDRVDVDQAEAPAGSPPEAAA